MNSKSAIANYTEVRNKKMCITDGVLRAQLDGELNEVESRAVNEHLAECSDCQRRAKSISSKGEHINALFSVLAPLPGEVTADPQIAFARFKTRHGTASRRNWPPFGRLRPMWVTLAILALISIISLSPSRIWAEKFLQLFRVKQIIVVSLDTNQMRRSEETRLNSSHVRISYAVFCLKK